MADAKANGPNLNGRCLINTKGEVAGEVVIRRLCGSRSRTRPPSRTRTRPRSRRPSRPTRQCAPWHPCGRSRIAAGGAPTGGQQRVKRRSSKTKSMSAGHALPGTTVVVPELRRWGAPTGGPAKSQRWLTFTRYSFGNSGVVH